MRRKRTCTLEDVAQKAGVSIMAASLVLNGARSSTRVSPDTRRRIVAIAEELDYRPPSSRNARRRKRVQTIGVVARKLGAEINLYVLELLDSILEAIAENRSIARVFHVNDWLPDQSLVLSMCDGDVDGLILIGPYFEASFAALLPPDIAMVALHPYERLPGAVNLDIDDAAGAYMAVEHLLDLGHQRIMHLPGGLHLTGARHRYEAYMRALHDHGLPANPDLVLSGGFSTSFAHETMRVFLSEHAGQELPTGAFCANDAIAVGCLQALSEYGLESPRDISIVGFDDTLAARMTLPPLTTVRQPLREMGRRAVDILAGGTWHRNDLPAEKQLELFPLELVLRQSTGPPPQTPATIPG